ncbi:MAG: hypothetical protein ACOCZK_04440 [Planctomycetota bacterium]
MQGSAFNDQDEDNIGEFGYLSQLAGAEPPFSAEVDGFSLISPDIGDGEARFGYLFRVYLPDGAGGMIDYATMKQRVAAGHLSQEAIDACERHFVCYAWPTHPGETGRRAFAITQNKQIHVADATTITLPPAWNALNPDATGAAGLLDDPAWVPLGSLGMQRRARPEPVERLVRLLLPARDL